MTLISDSGTTTGLFNFDVSQINSTHTKNFSSGSPSATVVSTYATPYESAYHIVLVKDTTNNLYEMFEFAMIDSSSNEAFVEFGNIGPSLGQVGITSVGTAKNVTYTPNANIDVEVKMFGIQMKIFDGNSDPQEIDMNNVVLTSDNDQYRGTKLDLQTSFGLYHDGFEIFRRVFDGSSASIVDTGTTSINVPNHFFVTGEKVLYTHVGTGSSNIGIATTSVGVSTDKLPNELFVVKIDDVKMQFAETSG